MALLFVFGVMNLAWIAALALLVLLEKLLRRPAWFARAAGAALLAWGALLAVQAGAPS
jgi:predicted metal-binding membrane protein